MHLFKELLCSLSLTSPPFLPSTEETSLTFLLIKTKSVETPVFTGLYVKNKTKTKKRKHGSSGYRRYGTPRSKTETSNTLKHGVNGGQRRTTKEYWGWCELLGLFSKFETTLKLTGRLLDRNMWRRKENAAVMLFKLWAWTLIVEYILIHWTDSFHNSLKREKENHQIYCSFSCGVE